MPSVAVLAEPPRAIPTGITLSPGVLIFNGVASTDGVRPAGVPTRPRTGLFLTAGRRFIHRLTARAPGRPGQRLRQPGFKGGSYAACERARSPNIAMPMACETGPTTQYGVC